MKRSVEDVIREIEHFLKGKGGAYDWDDFVSIPIEDPWLDSIRDECGRLREEYPPGECRQYCSQMGLQRLGQILEALIRSRTATAGGEVDGAKGMG